jgi:hypothetical protein
MAPPRYVTWFRRAPFRDLPFADIRDPIALVSDLVAFIRDPIPLVGRSVSFVCATLSLIKLAEPLFPSGGLGTGALSSVTNLLGDSALHCSLIASSVLLAALSELLSPTSAVLERLGRAHEDLQQAPWVDRWTHQHA